MDSYYRPDDEEDYNHYNQDHVLKRVSIEPEEEMKRLERDEIGIKSGIKGSEIKQYVDRAIQKLIYYRNPRVTLKAIGKNSIINDLSNFRSCLFKGTFNC